MREWFDRFGEAPEPLSPAQRRFLLIATILVVLTRLLAVSRSMWDWDEALFSSAVRSYDVTLHHPHPPGFPYYIALAKLIHLVIGSEFRALQLVTFLGAATLFPLMFFLGRELRAGFSTSVISAFLLAFFPNVWFFGGTAFSDVPSLALVLFACTLLIQGCRDGNRYLLGALMLGIAAGFRPQNLLVGLAPALLASWCRIRSTRSMVPLLLATLIGLVTLGVAYGGAAWATGDWRDYLEAVATHRQYIASVDSYTNPNRPSLLLLFDDFFGRPYRALSINLPVAVLAALGVLGGLFSKRRGLGLALAMFGPFCLAGWMMLDHHSVSRFSIAWAPLIAITAAVGVSVVGAAVAALWPRRAPGGVATGVVVEAAITVSLLALMIVWTVPALRRVQSEDSPPVQAIQWIKTNLPKDTVLYVHGGMGPHSDLLLREYPTRQFDDGSPLLMAGGQRVWVLKEGEGSSGLTKYFFYPQDHLWDLARRRYFDASVEPLHARIEFGSGWYDPERSDGRTWRWMGARADAALPPLPGCARLNLSYYVPLDAMPGRSPTVTVKVNGQIVDRFTPREAFAQRSFVVPSRSEGVNELVIDTDRAVNPAREGLGGDERTLGIRLDFVAWAPHDGTCH